MKKLSFLLIFAVLLSSISFTSCGKYEEGPGFSLLPKKTRLQQKWRPIEEVSPNGVVTQLSHDGDYTEFVKGGTVKYFNSSWNLGYEGTWIFTDDKLNVVTTYSYTLLGTQYDFVDTLKILKLKINALGLEDENGKKTYYEYF